MAGKDDETEEPRDDGRVSEEDGVLQPKGRRRTFGKVRRELNEEELGSSGVQKMLLDELERLDTVDMDIKSITTKYHESSVNLAVANNRLKTHRAFDILSTATVAVGSVTIGAAFSVDKNEVLMWSLIVGGSLLVLAGSIAKSIRS